LQVDVLLTIEEEYWRHTLGVAWRRKGWAIVERRLIDVVGSLELKDVEDLIRLMPAGLPETFTTADLAEKLGRPRSAAQQMAYYLAKAGVCVAVGKRGNNVEYRVGEAPV
jgi:predicted transcriptional regulator